MKNPLLLLALVASIPLVHAARAQNAPAVQSANAPSGADLLLAARKALSATYYSNPLSPAMQTVPPAEKLRRQREMVAQNAPALALLRQALAAGVVVAPLKSAQDNPFVLLAPARELAQQLAQQSDVRAADGDLSGAIDADFDVLRLGAQIGRGPFVAALSGLALAGIGRADLEAHAPLLDAAQLRAVADRWEKLNATRISYPELLREYEGETLNIMRPAFADPKARANLQQGDLFTPKQKRQLRTLTFAEFQANFQSLMQSALEQAALPYQTKAAPLVGADPISQWSADLLGNNHTRFNFERDLALNRLSIAALRLRAAKLESGDYPETFEAGTDPFSPTAAPLIYRREGEKYRLYSVGPDGKDDGGGAIQTLETDAKTGARKVTGRLQADSSGDIVAPVF